MTPTGAFGFYAGLNLVAWFMIFCFVRETKQLTLEEIDRTFVSMYSSRHFTNPTIEVFSVPTKSFLSYETKVWLPYFFKRYILRQKIQKPPPVIEKGDRVTQAP
jgi:hypothetical protein